MYLCFLFFWQVPVQIDINSSVVGPLCASACLKRRTGCREPMGRKCGEGAGQTGAWAYFFNSP